MKKIVIKHNPKLLALILLAINATLWIIPSNVLKLVAREQHVLLGRYSRTHFAWIMSVGIVSLIVMFIASPKSPALIKRRAFAVLAVIVGLVPMLLAVDIFLRLRTDYPYVIDKVVYHRPPHASYKITYEDVPEVKRSYPVAKPGYGRVECTLTYDAEGFRNRQDVTACDVVTLGDSFTEGSRVSDDQSWPVQFARISGLSVLNLGISGYSPPEYLAALKEYGLKKKPSLVVCALYEGNDFRSANVSVKRSVSFLQIVRLSPLMRALDEFLVDRLGPIGATRPFAGSEVLSWLPLAYPADASPKYYAFAPKQILELDVDAEEFDASPAWFAAKGLLREMQKVCREAGATLVIAYAPNKAHVIFPLAAANLPIEQVRAYAALRAKEPPPPAAEFMKKTLANLGNREGVIRGWCERQSIPFVSLTAALQQDASQGKQVYYTYDQHWSPEGHETAARAVADFWRAQQKSGVAAKHD